MRTAQKEDGGVATTVVRLKKGRDKPARAGHPWLFSGAFEELPQVEPGTLVQVEDTRGRFVAFGYANPTQSLSVRLLSWEPVEDIGALLRKRVRVAADLRRRMAGEQTNAYRVVNAEGDLLPGLVVDRYADVLVVQVLTAGMERLLDVVLDALQEEWQPRSIFERSDVPARREENLPMRRRLLRGEELGDHVDILENGLRFHVQPDAGQKTGFYLDQRDNRLRVRRAARDRRVLNCFAYTGGFSVAAALGGARSVTSIESSAPAVELLRANLQANGCEQGTILQADVFEALRHLAEAGERFDLIVLDPPAFAKKRHQVDSARRGYKDINLRALQLLEPGGELFTFSCSQYLDTATFRKTLFEAVMDARVRAQILEFLGHSWDHPVSVSHLEGEYLKGLHLRRP
jgi:23S rRNA (cytosine1962-C5)-methyltransferase